MGESNVVYSCRYTKLFEYVADVRTLWNIGLTDWWPTKYHIAANH